MKRHFQFAKEKIAVILDNSDEQRSKRMMQISRKEPGICPAPWK
jgi:hypothetical protein